MKPIIKLQHIGAVLRKPFKGYGLSASEIEIMLLALRGDTNELIAEKTNRPIGTVNAYSGRALKKLGISKSELGWFVIKQVKEILK